MKSLTQAVSADGTAIAYEAIGRGNPVILIGGAFNDRRTVTPLAEALAPSLTAIAYDRRGRGDSGKAATTTVEREVDDIAALIEAVGAPVALFGHSSGAALALEAAAAGLPVRQVAVYEPSYVVDRSRPRPGRDLADRVRALVALGRRDDAAALFLTEAIGMPAEVTEGMKAGPMWQMFSGLAHTVPDDVAACRGMRLPAERFATLEVPVLAVNGSNTAPWLAAATKSVALTIPGARLVVLEGQDHGVLHNPGSLVPVLIDFLA
ncbi:MAG TPA: alpha/beta hydrolase [Acidimicrobiales bacterium]|nr:alpha/beta hydrolase [Acidimicrobiales bacterium]